MFIPQVGTMLPVTLPSEILRAKVVRVVNDDTVICELPQPLSKGHQYKKGDLVGARRRKDPIFGEQWKSVEQIRQPTPAELAPEKPAKAPKRKPTKRAKKLAPAPKAKKNAADQKRK